MKQYNPPHPGKFILATYMEPYGMEPYGLGCRFLAEKLDVAPSTLHRVLPAKSRVSAEMALRLSKALGRSPESWLAMQQNYDLWHAQQKANLGNVKSQAGNGIGWPYRSAQRSVCRHISF